MKNTHQVFKYLVYLAVLTNVFLFLQKELKAATHRFGADFSIFQVFEAFTSTLDTAAWVILLFLFELETYVIPRQKITAFFQWLLTGLRGLCFVAIFSSFLGYVKGYNWLKYFEETPIIELCELVGQSWMQELDKYEMVEQGACKTLAKGNQILKHSQKVVYTDDHYLTEAKWLAGINVLNSLSWILVVILLEIDVWLIRQSTLKRTLKFNQYLKNICYFSLLFCAIYWGVYGDFLEFWDAFLWIIAFVFIELNIRSSDIFAQVKSYYYSLYRTLFNNRGFL